MRNSVRYACSIGTVAAILAGCNGSQTFHATPASYSSSSSLTEPLGTYSSLYSFKSNPDGELPAARLVAFNAILYGTTSAGGAGSLGRCCGTVFAISTGKEKVLYRFRGEPDGARPVTELTAVGSLLYGTTFLGGTICEKALRGCGTVFSITPSGTERVVYRFPGVPDGAHPSGSLINVNGTLYGTTRSGGVKCAIDRLGCGTVYSMSSSGKERVLHRFTGKPDGALPTGNLVFLNGKLYGTTQAGGTCNWGTVFEITLSGRERVLYNPSCTGVDIVYPTGLVTVHGVLYGTSQEGGTRRHGALYSVTTRGEEHILQSFNGGQGSNPLGSLIVVNGALYGTTASGGYGYGNVYTLTTSGRLQVLYRFKGVPDGSTPYAGLAYLNGRLYGTTHMGGSWCRYQYCQQGYGTVFRLSP
jgi:uncharacterized repeat protein (TIGR03803 family)